MKTLNILTDSELKQLFGPLEDILPLHEGKDGYECQVKGQHFLSATCLATGIDELTAARSISSGKCIEREQRNGYEQRERERDNCFRSWRTILPGTPILELKPKAERSASVRCIPVFTTVVYAQLHLRRVVVDAWNVVVEDSSSMVCSILDLLYRLKPKGDTSIDAIGQIYLEWVGYRCANMTGVFTCADEF